MVDTKKKFLLFLESSFINLEILIKEKLKSKGYNFDNDMFKDIVFFVINHTYCSFNKNNNKKNNFYNYKNWKL